MMDGMPGFRRGNPLTLEATPLTFGPGASEEVGRELRRLGARRVMVVSDPGVAKAGITHKVRSSIEAEGIECETFERARVEPTLDSFQEAADFAADGGFDGFVGVGGGSSMDTAKAADLIATHPAPVLDYVAPPIGEGRMPPGPLMPLVAVPTTSGTGSEVTSAAVLDIPEHGVKTAIAHHHLQPHRAIIDPLLARTLPKEVTASCGLDVVCQALEYLSAKPRDELPVADSPEARPPYGGSNPISDYLSETSLRYSAKFFRRSVEDGGDIDARGAMMLAAALARIGFAPAGVHIPHACAYPIASLKHGYQPPGYPKDHAFIPHGHSVIATAPAAFRFTFPTAPEKHLRAAEILNGKPTENADEDTLPQALIQLMKDIVAPRGLRELGYGEDDVDALVRGAIKQERLLRNSPREVGASELAAIFRESMENW